MPEDIASVVMGLPTEKISLEHNKNMLFVQPLAADLDGEIYAIGKSARSYVLSLHVVSKDQRDKQVRLVAADESLKERVEQVKTLTPLGLLKAMALGQELDGVFVDKKAFPLFEDARVRITAEAIWDAVAMKGYICKIDNLSQQPFDFRTLSIQGLVALSIHKGTAYLVFYE